MYRVYDKQQKKWIKQNVYLSPEGDLILTKPGLFKFHSIKLVPSCRYAYQMYIGLTDKTGKKIYEGDICETDEFTGVVVYYPDHSRYFLIDYLNNRYYPLLRVVSNIFDKTIYDVVG